MIDFDNKTTYNGSITLLEKIAEEFSDKEIELILTDDTEIRTINKEFRNIDAPTDVLSFPYEQIELLGSIVISYDYIQRGAQLYKHSEADEFTLLFIHGMLHILGFDHEADNGEMRLKEMEIIHKYNLPKSLIVRTAG
jgi:probable rRNA maturation factor